MINSSYLALKCIESRFSSRLRIALSPVFHSGAPESLVESKSRVSRSLIVHTRLGSASSQGFGNQLGSASSQRLATHTRLGSASSQGFSFRCAASAPNGSSPRVSSRVEESGGDSKSKLNSSYLTRKRIEPRFSNLHSTRKCIESRFGGRLGSASSRLLVVHT